MTQPVPFCVAVAVYGPGAVASRSSVRFPEAVDRVVHPVPAAVTVTVEAPAAKSRSPAAVVVRAPELIAFAVPIAPVVPSTGLTLSRPAYSWMYTSAQPEIEVPNVAVTVLAPAAMFLAKNVCSLQFEPQLRRAATLV